MFAEEVETKPGSPGRDLDWDAVAGKFMDLVCGLGGVGDAPAKETFQQLENIERCRTFAGALAALVR